MGNTSDRVAGDRHGAKAHRSDSGGHKDHEPSSKMVDSTDDPNIFNTHGPESKVLLLVLTTGRTRSSVFAEGCESLLIRCVSGFRRERIYS